MSVRTTTESVGGIAWRAIAPVSGSLCVFSAPGSGKAFDLPALWCAKTRHMYAAYCSYSGAFRCRSGRSADSSTAVRPEQPTHRVRRDVARDLRVLLQAAERVAVPVLAERDVDPQAVPVPHELACRDFAHSEQHLELVLLERQPALRDESLALREQLLVMGRDRGVRAGLKQFVQAPDEVLAHLLVLLVGDQRRLDVDALDETDVRLKRGQVVDVSDRAAQGRLQDEADVLVPFRAELAVQLERVRSRVASSMSIRTKLPLSAAWLTTLNR